MANTLNAEMVAAMKCGMFNNCSYYGKRTCELKSGVCKYYRRGVRDKFEWCIVEMMIFGLRKKGIMTNILNRLKILVFEEIVISEVDKIVKLIEILDEVDEEEDWNKRVELLLEFVEVSGGCRRGRICSYVNNWWKFNRESYEMEDVKLEKVLRFRKEGDSEELLKLGELLIGFIEKRDERVIDVFNKMYVLEGKMGRRYRRSDGVYLYWEIVEGMFGENAKLMKIVEFSRRMFYRKSMKERPYYGVWVGMFVVNGGLRWDDEFEYEKKDVVLEEYFKNRKDIEIDDYVVNDYHVNKKFGLDKFAKVGAFVVDEDLSDLGEMGEKYRKFYVEKKQEVKKEDGEKKDGEKKDGKKKVVKRKKKDLESGLEMVDWSRFEIVKVIEEGVCGGKKCCIIVKFEGKRYVLKEFGKSLNWGRDYMMMDECKKEFGLLDLEMRRIRSNRGMEKVDKSKRSLVGNWMFEEKESVYCMMKYYENIGDLGKNKEVLVDEKLKKELLKIRLFDGLFRSSDNILRNVLVGKDKELISIDEGDCFGKRQNIFNKRGDWCVKNMDRDMLEECLVSFDKIREEKMEYMVEKLREYGLESKVEEFRERFSKFREIVNSELE